MMVVLKVYETVVHLAPWMVVKKVVMLDLK